MAKTIIIGLDGGDDLILKSLGLSTIHEISEKGLSKVLSRGNHSLAHAGWITLLTGAWGEQHGGFYRYPLKRKYEFTSEIGTQTYYANPNLVPLWDLANKKGLSVGFLNVPTTFPAPSVEGFFLSGAGGGQIVKWPEGAYPHKLHKTLETFQYIVDIRLSKLKTKHLTFEEYVKQLTEMEIRRKDVFLCLMKEYNPELGFVVFVGPDRIQHVLMANVERLQKGEPPISALDFSILEYYQTVDRCIREIWDSYSDYNMVIVSDHGFAPYRQKIDLNAMLEHHGFLVRPPVKARKRQADFKALANKYIPEIVKPLARMATHSISPLEKKMLEGIAAFDWSQTIAFNFRHTYGLFINTKDRFPNGIVSDADYPIIIRELIDLVNEVPELKAETCRKNFLNSPFAHRLPDISISMPDDMFAEDIELDSSASRNHFTISNPYYKLVDNVVRDRSPAIFNGIHRNKSICYTCGPGVKSAQNIFRKNELTEFYNFITRLLDQ